MIKTAIASLHRAKKEAACFPAINGMPWNVIAYMALENIRSREMTMKVILAIAVVASAVLSTAVGADAKGCLKGAVVGGVAGHYAGHHGLIGAAAGCAYGRHEANKRERLQRSNTDGSGRDLSNGQERM